MDTQTRRPTTEAASPVVSAETKPNGPVAAVMLAAGIGAVTLGLFTILSEASEGVHEFLEFNEGVGPLSGKTILAALAFLVSWGGLHAALRDREVQWRPLVTATIVLLAIGLLFTYPPFFTSFASE